MPSFRSFLKLLLVATLVTVVRENSIVAMPPPDFPSPTPPSTPPPPPDAPPAPEPPSK